MALKSFNPDTSSRRQLIIVNRDSLYKGKPLKSLTKGLCSKGGRNNTGRITMRFRGGGCKNRYRIIDFKRSDYDVEGVVQRLEYDPNRTAFIALISYPKEKFSYILAPQRLSVGDKVISSNGAVDIKPGNAMPLRFIPVGTIVHNVEMKPQKGGQISRSAGSYARVVERDRSRVLLRLSSGEMRFVQSSCMASIGAVSNQDQININYAKAGRSRWLKIRPHVRGVAMNPVDHPLGGGEGKTSGGRHPCSPWGKLTKGKRTRSNKSTNVFIASSRHKNKK
ncbi:50S ribosomal protein L2 [Candidatus Liberibacter solanacearum]|uniref:Large ribosomal subunit protein uL2 n=1 Tax=Candidatus Liberibacter solanacearum TaxID=556287 RepID=A0A095BEU2_9HYPH|nr:50S ribosomal protein L2 [Candidatus Liberibacter solanacearum]KGB27318.1 50S ribosomal protein L2 [Candidatus Liberibacter solanacearum]KJZ80745.1 50S ribosomal protein L2 [Candidatus Liberibacter solanacearum]KJZ81842.1 LSU ribosomal protein L2p (L8e) [Candidatus Liberibacter solanacearum]KQC48895.1 50S ribosomal protein L2 [Candidatus Liberibacter solanacearum]RPD36839.1 50S ribosomal protein L2 [Candidatus Liberibacter solanacearum]